jgi:N-alpha-acetyl-L-2,4-diaminobutyrate deacetylase
MIDLGDSVKEGQVIARIHPIGRTGVAPAEIRTKLTGLLAARHFPGLVKPGDCVAVVGTVD